MAVAVESQYMVVGSCMEPQNTLDHDSESFTTVVRDDRPCEIIQGLFIGSFLAEKHGKLHLQRAGVTHVIQAAEGLWQNHPTDFHYMQLHVDDEPSTDLVCHFAKSFKFIDEAIAAGGAVFVHCVAGVSRSATICIGYLMWKHGLSYQQAFKLVWNARPWVNPNAGFKAQLLRLEALSCDLSKWCAWRHVWQEQPLVVSAAAATLKVCT